MKDNDSVLLENAYNLVQEGKFKSALAAAALGLTSASGHSHDVDSVNFDNRPTPQQTEPKQLDGDTDYHKAFSAFETAKKMKSVDELTLQRIALDKDIAQRYALFLIQHGREIPPTLKKAVSKYAGDLEGAFHSQQKN